MNITDIPLKKLMMKNELKNKLPLKSQVKSKSDIHAKTPPKQNELMVNPAIGCPNQCVYCYIQDLGQDYTQIHPYGLHGNELLYALLSNPYYQPTRYGTPITIGELTEPFNGDIKEKTIEYLKTIEKLGNPTRFTTKEYIDREMAKTISKIKLPITPIISITSIENAKILEPQNKIEKRFNTIKNLRKENLKPILLIEPLIPEITTKEIDEILDETKRAGISGAIPGELIITENIINRLRKTGIDINPILRKIKMKEIPKRRTKIKTKSIKKEIIEIIEEKRLKAFPTPCCANTHTANVPCINPNHIRIREERRTSIEEREINTLIKTLTKRKIKETRTQKNKIIITMEVKIPTKERNILKYNLQTLLRRKIQIKII